GRSHPMVPSAQAAVPIFAGGEPLILPPADVAVTGPEMAADAKLTSVGIFPAPGAPPSGTLANPNALGQPLVFLVKEQHGDWLKVALPGRPNGATGWIQASDVALRPVASRLKVEL